MRILVNTRLLIKHKLDGIGWFTYETLKRITTQHPNDEFIFLFDRPFDKSFLFSDNVIPFQIGPPARHPFLWYIWFQNSVPRIIHRFQPDLFLSPDGYLTTNTTIPQLAVMHDINFEHFPQDLPFFYRHYYRHFFPKFAQRANRIATVSEFSKQDIIELYHIKSDKIDVVYNGCNEMFKPIDFEAAKAVRGKYTAAAPYFVFVGNLHPRKNITRMLKAFEAFKQMGDFPHKLLIVGEKMWWGSEMEQAYQTHLFKDEIVFTGRLEAADLWHAIAAAQALLFVSYFEGFGIPVLEAMQCGTPVIAGNLTALPEVGGDAPVYVNPYEISEIAQAMKALSTDAVLVDRCIALGQTRATQFSWQKTADKLWQSILKTQNA